MQAILHSLIYLSWSMDEDFLLVSLVFPMNVFFARAWSTIHATCKGTQCLMQCKKKSVDKILEIINNVKHAFSFYLQILSLNLRNIYFLF